MRVLVVDNDVCSAQAINAILKAEGMIAEPAEFGEDAVDLGKHYDFDVLILEERLPDIAGLEVLRRLRAACVRTPVLMLSETAGAHAIARALAAGADNYLSKPFERANSLPGYMPSYGATEGTPNR
jgi:two-component system cell cycle response regulator CtrA